MENIDIRIKKVITHQLGIDAADVKPESAFVADLGADSLDEIEIVIELEAEFDLEIPDVDAVKIKTVQQAIDYIAAKTAK